MVVWAGGVHWRRKQLTMPSHFMCPEMQAQVDITVTIFVILIIAIREWDEGMKERNDSYTQTGSVHN